MFKKIYEKLNVIYDEARAARANAEVAKKLSASAVEDTNDHYFRLRDKLNATDKAINLLIKNAVEQNDAITEVALSLALLMVNQCKAVDDAGALEAACAGLLDYVHKKYPGEPLTCEHMRAIEAEMLKRGYKLPDAPINTASVAEKMQELAKEFGNLATGFATGTSKKQTCSCVNPIVVSIDLSDVTEFVVGCLCGGIPKCHQINGDSYRLLCPRCGKTHIPAKSLEKALDDWNRIAGNVTNECGVFLLKKDSLDTDKAK